MKVLMITPGWPSKSNPNSSPFIFRQYESLIKHGIDVTIFNFKGNKNPVNYILALAKIQILLRRNTYDLIHAQWGHTALLTLNTKLPLVVTYRGMDLEGIINKNGKYSIYGKFLTWISKFTATIADEVIVVSKSLGNKLSRQDYTILPSGINLELFKPLNKFECRRTLNLPHNKKLILFAASRNHPRKRYDLAAKAISILKQNFNCELIVCENKNPDKVPFYMNAADCLILTSTHEGSPNVIKEALACNLPVVSVEVGDVKERKGNLKHFEICDSKPEEIAKAMSKVLSNENEINNRQSVLHLDENIITSKVIEIYHKAINKKL